MTVSVTEPVIQMPGNNPEESIEQVNDLVSQNQLFRRRGITQKKAYNKLMTVSVTEPVIQTPGNNPKESIQVNDC